MAAVSSVKGVSMPATEMAAAEMPHVMTAAMVPDDRGVGEGCK
jgi:hypothetical protein